MGDKDVLKALTAPEDDRAWKLAAGETLADIQEQTHTTNGRVTRLELAMVLLIGAAAGAGAPELVRLAGML